MGTVRTPEDKNSLIVDEEAAQHVRDIFHWFVADDMSKRGIALKLNARDVPNRTVYKQRVLKSRYQNPHAKRNDGLLRKKRGGEDRRLAHILMRQQIKNSIKKRYSKIQISGKGNPKKVGNHQAHRRFGNSGKKEEGRIDALSVS